MIESIWFFLIKIGCGERVRSLKKTNVKEIRCLTLNFFESCLGWDKKNYEIFPEPFQDHPSTAPQDNLEHTLRLFYSLIFYLVILNFKKACKAFVKFKKSKLWAYAFKTTIKTFKNLIQYYTVFLKANICAFLNPCN